MTPGLDEVVVATADKRVAETVLTSGGFVIRTSGEHTNGTECVAEASANLGATHVLLIQGDEPLLLPRHVENMVEAITDNSPMKAWIATGPISSDRDLDLTSVVKAMVGLDSRIVFLSRRNPSIHGANRQKYMRKILGIMAYTHSILQEINNLPPSIIEAQELIEQLRLIENGYPLQSVAMKESTQSVNEPGDVNRVFSALQESKEQQELFAAYSHNYLT
jgi:3-deoxy-manno-octulosonate cytidylyltransferase (CMP-KDO synthetase)